MTTDEIQSVVILDDDTVVRQSFCDYFDDSGFRSLPADSGEVALDLLKAESPAAAIVDIRIGEMTGHDFIRVAYPLHRGCAFVICTGLLEYRLPPDLEALEQVSPTVFKKPVTRLDPLQREVQRMIALIRRAKIGGE